MSTRKGWMAWMGLGALCLPVLPAAPAGATVLAVAENGNVRTANAVSVDGAFSATAPATAFGALPTATLQSTFSDKEDIDWFSFTGKAGATVYFDVDNDPWTQDTVLSLFNASGSLLALSDDSQGPGPAYYDPDPGSYYYSDSFLGNYVLPSDGTYYLAVTLALKYPTVFWGAVGTAPFLFRPDGEMSGWSFSGVAADDSFDPNLSDLAESGTSYTIHFSNSGADVAGVADASAVPEPGTVTLLGTGILGLVGFARRRLRK